jgi:tetratricopeptide (TPR) repeat protein
VRSLLEDPAVAPFAKASALAELGNHASPEAQPLIERELRAEEPWLRLGAVLALRGAPEPVRTPLLIDRAQDTASAVRLAAAPLLAELNPSRLAAPQRREHAKLLAEYADWLAANSDRAGAWVSRAALHRGAGDLTAAHRAFETALQRDETELTAHLNFADYFRSMQQDPRAEQLLRRAVELYPDSADPQFALGLLLVRQKQTAAGVLALARAVELAPNNSHYVYVYAVALYSTHDVARALATLHGALARFPENRALRSALQGYCAQQPAGSFPESCS